ncbi:MAG: Fic family protein [Gammaproteobacteria bacterium]|nr:MAG: Fic family protein [Gammaproteobacteria bacterium]
MNREAGRYITSTVGGESYQACLPAPLPPDPPLALDGELLQWLEKANRAIGRLDGISDGLPDSHLFLYQYVRKEALLSSQIEGTQSSFSDLLLFEMDEAPGVPLDDVREVSNYVAAMNHGLVRLGAGLPLSLRLLREIHAILLRHGRGAHKQPGEFRRSQNWLGGSRPGNAVFVPPPPEYLMECLDPFERFLHDEAGPTPVLLKASLAHVQFETIHPFLDGNGRLGRLLITLILINEGVLREPLLYLSLHFKTRRSDYYDHLQRVRLQGDWEGWLRFFLRGVFETAQQAVESTRTVLELFQQDRARIEGLGRIAGSCLQLHQRLQQKAIVNIPDSARELAINRTTISNCIRRLQELGIVREITGQRRNRLFVYDRYVQILSEGTEPL